MASESSSSIIVVFGRPGAGKTTIATAAIKKFENEYVKDRDVVVNGLDLDVCVPQWMKDNFSKGIYPTLEQRKEFAIGCCKYVRGKLGEAAAVGSSHATIISFSFVNTDLRDIFRSNFPDATWILIDTSKEEAEKRINSREDHFYKGNTSKTSREEVATANADENDKKEQDEDNNNWEFADVTFDHIVFDGGETVGKNVSKMIEILRKLPKAAA